MRVGKHGCDVLDSRVFLRKRAMVKSTFLNTWGIGRIIESFANPRLRLEFA